ncbi:eukaryotic translation initiation factor 2 beta [Neolentinus lepideus HHB14362 ss-1]|uniref:Eukaryotic translation initiation factor 2 beta n=1 Tax=Neolentinus lepideus HHB14362 ss-1 TaxID=1314782 RepID=A0A165T421_9AGAM|nr:eukaryotic translation initiation factor 2 beta [Neolentinus lepideus HHB14362 ss-1]
MASEEPLFDPTLKKKKPKKKTVAFSEDPLGADADPTTPAPEVIEDHTMNGEAVNMGPTTMHEQLKQSDAAADDGEEDPNAMFGDLKKKKKKKKEIPLDLDGEGSGTSTPTTAPAATEDLDFSDLKKKKKSSKKKATFDLDAFEKELQSEPKKEDGDEDEERDGEHLLNLDESELGENVFAHSEAPSGLDAGNEPWLKSDRDYTYSELLQRFYASLHASNPALLTSTGKRYVIVPPSLAREGNKKTIFTNITDICRRMHRQPEHVIQYLFSEMGTTGSVDGQGRLVIKGRFQQKQLENVLRRYIVEYVTCKTCKSFDTLLTKENRIFFMTCESCGSRRSVNAIKTGFQAQVGKRSKTKPAQ